MTKIAFRLLAFAFLAAFAGCHRPAAPTDLRVAAAADLKFALGDLASAFQAQHPEITIKPTFGSSGTLCAQIENGAPFDLFLAADISFPERLIRAGRARADSLFSYAIGHLVIWVPASSPVDVARLGPAALDDASIKKIAIANPEHAPYGRAAVAALRSLGVYGRVESRLVLGENIAQATQFVETGAADAGVIALSLALAPPLANKGRFWPVPADCHPPLQQAGTIPTSARAVEAAEAFCAWLQSPPARAILDRHGFARPANAAP